MVMPSGTLEIWLNAFIPYDVPNYTRLITQGAMKGQSAVPLPGVARLNPLNWGHDWDSGFLTDQRGFSNSKSASVRMQSAVSIAVSPKEMVATFPPMRTSGTVGVKLDTGDVVGRSNANMKSCVFEPEKKDFRPAFGRFFSGAGAHAMLVLKVKGAASDPLVSASADIDYQGHFKIVQSEVDGLISVDFLGSIDAFPAFECYASWNGQVRTIFAASPPPGNTVVDLLGGPNRRVSGSAQWN